MRAKEERAKLATDWVTDVATDWVTDVTDKLCVKDKVLGTPITHPLHPLQNPLPHLLPYIITKFHQCEYFVLAQGHKHESFERFALVHLFHIG